MTAKEGVSFNVASTDLRNLLTAKGFNDLPAVSIRNRMIYYSSIKKELITREIQTFKITGGGGEFSLTFDEWTSTETSDI